MHLTTVTVSVPDNRVADLLRFAADLAADHAIAEVATENTDSVSVDPEKVRAAYLGGESQVWRPMLEFLAERAGEWVDWTDIYTAMDRTARQMSGALGAAERRVRHENLPYEKRELTRGAHQFRMPVEVADVIIEVANEHQ